MSVRSANLAEPLSAFMETQVHNGPHQDASKVVPEGLHRDEDALLARQERTEAIGAVIRARREAIARGTFTTVRGPEDAQTLITRLTGHAFATRPGGVV